MIMIVIETINFTIESLAFQNRHLNSTHSISDIKLPWSQLYSSNCKRNGKDSGY